MESLTRRKYVMASKVLAAFCYELGAHPKWQLPITSKKIHISYSLLGARAHDPMDKGVEKRTKY
jgi:hypothetical protein